MALPHILGLRARHPSRAMPADIRDYTPVPANVRALMTAAARRYFQPTFLGIEHLEDNRPALYVGNHTLYALIDVPLVMEYLQREHGITLRPLGDHGHFRYPGWRQLLLRSGVVPGTPENCDRLMAARQSMLVYPGGAREVWHHKDENYRLIWKKRLGFVRHAARHGYDIIPLASLGADECFTIIADGEDFQKSRWVQRVLKLTGNEHMFRDGEAVPPLVRGLGPTLIPRPQALYFGFGERISTVGVNAQDDEVLMQLRKQVETAIYQELDRLRTYRQTDREENWAAWRKRWAG